MTSLPTQTSFCIWFNTFFGDFFFLLLTQILLEKSILFHSLIFVDIFKLLFSPRENVYHSIGGKKNVYKPQRFVSQLTAQHEIT